MDDEIAQELNNKTRSIYAEQNQWKDTRDEGYCWMVRDSNGDMVCLFTMDYSAFIYEFGMPDDEELLIVSWDG